MIDRRLWHPLTWNYVPADPGVWLFALMPRFMVENVLESEGIDSRIQMFGNGILQAEDKLKVKRMACRMGVSFTSFLIRLRELKLIEYRPLNEYIAGMGINV